MGKELESEETEKEQAWEDRVLCSDEGCIGVIGPDGRCKECGRRYEGPLPLPSPPPPDCPEYEDGATRDAQPDADTGEESELSDPEAGDEAWRTRKLCRDESCIGVIGPDGRCKECGRPYDE